MPVFLLNGSDPRQDFPPPYLASDEGLLAIGGDLSEARLLNAYRRGVFPWFSANEPILWWSPDPRLVLYPHEFRLAKSLKKLIDKQVFTITFDTAFEAVIDSCAHTPRRKETGTWITPGMIHAYCGLHRLGYAHSVEAWYEERLAGGLYGVALGGCFFGESMFSHISNASKVALAALVGRLQEMSFSIIDCQVTTDHLMQFGAREIPRRRFMDELALAQSLGEKGSESQW
jgi:leucyl/phenylalanyl-tRNA--protein transferase